MEAYAPFFSHHFGIHPWDIGRLTVDQFHRYRRWIEKRKEPGEDDE